MAKVASGSTPLRARHNDFFQHGTIPWVKTMDLTNGVITITDEKITQLAAKKCKPYHPGTVLVAMYGGFNQIGRTGLLKIEAAVNQAISAIALDKNVAVPEYLLGYLNAKIGIWKNFAASSRKDPNITRKDVCNFPIILPPLPEQHRIVAVLETWDKATEKLERKIELKEKVKEGLSLRLLLGQFSSIKNRKFQNTRFFKIPTDWEVVRIEDVAGQMSEKNKHNRVLPVLSCTKTAGLVDSLKFFKKQVFSKKLDTYKIVHRNQFVYATNHIEEGSIGLQNLYESGLVSPMYTVFQSNEKILTTYLYPLLKTELFRCIFEASTSASVDRRGSLRWKTFKKIEIPLPPIEEQKFIADLLTKFDDEIAALKRKLHCVKKQKTYLLNHLITGRIRTPENMSISKP